MIPNILAERYASSEMRDIWSPSGKVRYERELWIAVLKAQDELGLSVSPGAIEAYEKVIDQIDLESIRKREAESRHDVKARIEEFCGLAGFEEIHRGMTSRDLTENVEQLQVARSLEVVQKKTAATLAQIAAKAEEFVGQVFPGRTHNVPAQPTTFGKRLAMYGEELLHAAQTFSRIAASYPVRGIKGAVGTQLDLKTLFSDEKVKVDQLEASVLKHLGFSKSLHAVGQVYPRSLDHEVIAGLVGIASGPSNLARSLRLMAGHETASEGFAPGQTGSSAMPHKMNSRSCERVNGFLVLLRGYETMAAGLAGDQWHEGDVSCSVVRRVALPDAFFSIDGLFETFLTVLGQMEVYPAVIARENAAYFPFLSSTTLLMEAVRTGTGRETAHKAIKKHAISTVKDLRSGEITQNNFAERLGADSDFPLDTADIEKVITGAADLIGLAKEQVGDFSTQVNEFLRPLNPEWKDYRPGQIL
ncbi:adenylosuccinate lyase [Puniceicoccus vermicola]|uniref:Adenylosuccinate lyase n=1 Tax=Puniceicoccus vermicola TaxID=388746 RepID=A0A7X1AVU2_9BACT|nr:adenylosuccinate lyase [Puniceicoccus vermicola]MBC2600699.1 adenylosuccinate lyase [Puniceicoccus vermicola]